MNRAFRAGETIEDYCRACKTDRLHTVIVVDDAGRPIRVSCDYCDSQHNYRGGPRVNSGSASSHAPSARTVAAPRAHHPPALVSDRERTAMPVSASDSGQENLELLLRRIIREEIGLVPWSASGTAERQGWVADLADRGALGDRRDREFARDADWRIAADRILRSLKH